MLSVSPGSTIITSVGTLEAATINTGSAAESHPVLGAEPVTAGATALLTVESVFLVEGVSRHPAITIPTMKA
jgi:hypothetical protein